MYEEQEFSSVEELAAATADRLAGAAAHFSFALFRDKPFRKLARLESLPVGEQDRIFNELLVAHLTLLMLTLEAPDLRVAAEGREYLRLLQTEIPRAHVRSLLQMGVAAEHARDWEKLIDLRFEEYCQDRHRVRAAAMEVATGEDELTIEDLDKIQLLLPVQTVAIGCHRHVCRGKVDGRDNLFQAQLRALATFYVETRVPLEGGRITPLMRLKMAMRKALRSRA